jgi:uncharacterized membrane protein YoaK (UPF0700 family)
MENTQQEFPKEDLISDYVNEIREQDLEQHKLSVKKARNTLYMVAALVFASEMIGMFMSDEGFTPLVLIISLVEAGIFVALALWTKRKPYSAVVVGIIAFIGIYTLAFAGNLITSDWGSAVQALLGGFIFKIIVLVTLFQALRNAKAVQSHNNNLRRLE